MHDRLETLELRLAFSIARRYEEYRRRFDSITLRARPRFEGRAWRALQNDIVERIDAYEATLADAIAEVRELLSDRTDDRDLWAAARDLYARLVSARPDAEVAATYFNSVTRRLFDTRGIDEAIEFTKDGPESAPAAVDTWFRREPLSADAEEVIDSLLRDRRFHATWRDRHGDVLLGAAALRRALAASGIGDGSLEVLVPTFYRGRGAYVIARVVSGRATMPLVLAIHHHQRGLYLGAVLSDPDDVSVLFSYTHSEFVVRLPDPAAIIGFVRTLIPHRRISELYDAVGLRKHGKTELFRDLVRHLEGTDDRFVHAPGIPGLVMIVFTLSGYDVVFKVIRDRFPPQKTVTPAQVRARYAIVSRHDRAGRLIDANEFRRLTFPVSRFDDALLGELQEEAGRTVTVVDGNVHFESVYVERQVTPLDIYLRQAADAEAAAAIVDYGTAIKNLAATNIFPGDMLIKNFGVTRRGRVVFYDYDELSLLTDCNFRPFPQSDDPDDEMAATPWFGVGEGDIFPEEFRSFLGVGPDLRRVFEERHGDLYDVDFWHRVQDRINSGESIEIFPYRRAAALHAAGA